MTDLFELKIKFDKAKESELYHRKRAKELLRELEKECGVSSIKEVKRLLINKREKFEVILDEIASLEEDIENALRKRVHKTESN